MAARRRGSRTGSFLVLSGIVGVLTATFLAGVWTGHNWPVLFGEAKKAPASEPSSGKRGVAERKPADALPALTFYDELKAPLTAPPPPPPKAKAPRPAERPREIAAEPPPAAPAPADAAAAPARSELPPVEPSAPPPSLAAVTADGGARFTIQVAAYNARTPAEALRATLAAAGHDARVVEAATSTGIRYRVQVGAFVTRPAAQDAATRLSAERALATFVTTR